MNGKPASASGTGIAPQDRVYRERVLVKVYDLGQTIVTRGYNRMTKSYGAFHTGVEVYGREWSFGMTFDDWSTGVTWNPPGMNPDHKFRETLSMGYTSCSPEEVWQIIEDMKIDWRGCTYNVLTRNCHNFSNTLCVRLGVGSIPSWINDLADTGAATVEFIDSADSGYDGGQALYDFFSDIRKSFTPGFSSEPTPSLPHRNSRPRYEEEAQQRQPRLELQDFPKSMDRPPNGPRNRGYYSENRPNACTVLRRM